MAKAPRVSFKEGWGMSEVTGAGTMFIRLAASLHEGEGGEL